MAMLLHKYLCPLLSMWKCGGSWMLTSLCMQWVAVKNHLWYSWVLNFAIFSKIHLFQRILSACLSNVVPMWPCGSLYARMLQLTSDSTCNYGSLQLLHTYVMSGTAYDGCCKQWYSQGEDKMLTNSGLYRRALCPLGFQCALCGLVWKQDVPFANPLITFSNHLKYLTRQGFPGLLKVMNLIMHPSQTNFWWEQCLLLGDALSAAPCRCDVPPFPPSSELHAVAQVQLSIVLMDGTSLFPLGLVMTSK